MKKKMISLLIICTMALSLLASCAAGGDGEISPSPSAKPSAIVAQEKATQSESSLFSRIDTITLDGEPVTGSGVKGEVLTVLNIWATWCSPCVQELPHLQEISEYYSQQGVKVVGVMQDGVDNQLEPVDSAIGTGKTLLADAGANYAVILPDETIIQEFVSQMEYFPTTFFLDADGNIVKTVIGSKDAEGWRNEIDGVLEEIS